MLGLHHQLAAGVEERGRAVLALLDVGRVGGADQGRAHLLAGGAEAADHHLQRDRVEAAHRCASARIVPVSSTGRRPARRDDEGRLRQLEDDRALRLQARRRARRAGPASASHSPSKRISRLPSSEVAAGGGGRRRAAARERPSRAGCGRGRPRRRGRGGRSAPRGRARSARRGRRDRGARRPRPAARTPGRRSASRRRSPARRPRGPPPSSSTSESTSARDPLGGQVLAAQHHRQGRVAAPVRGAEAERREDPARPRAEDPVDLELGRDRGGVHRPGAAEREQREAARVDAALDGDDAERPDHLLVGDPDDPLGGLELARGRARPPARPPPRRRRRRRGRPRRPGSSPAARTPSRRLASVTVGSVPPRP